MDGWQSWLIAPDYHSGEPGRTPGFVGSNPTPSVEPAEQDERYENDEKAQGASPQSPDDACACVASPQHRVTSLTVPLVAPDANGDRHSCGFGGGAALGFVVNSERQALTTRSASRTAASCSVRSPEVSSRATHSLSDLSKMAT